MRCGPVISGLTVIGCVIGTPAFEADAPTSAMTPAAAITATPRAQPGTWSFCFMVFLSESHERGRPRPPLRADASWVRSGWAARGKYRSKRVNPHPRGGGSANAKGPASRALLELRIRLLL